MPTDPDQWPRHQRRPADYGYDESRFGVPYDPSAGRSFSQQFSEARYGPQQVSHDDEADWPTSPGIPVIPEATRPPSVRLTAILSFLFGPFGAAPASGAAHRAREVGASSGRYWVAFLLGWLAHLLVLTIVLGLLLAGAGSRQDAAPDATASAKAPAAPSATPSPTPTPTPTPTPVAFPAGATQCSDSVAVNSSTSCQFALNVETAFKASSASGGTVQVTATSPVTNKTYSMSCVVATGSVTTCTGGNNAVVYLR